MNKFLSLIVLVAVFTACKTPELVPGKPTLKNPKDVIAKVYQQSSPAKMIHIKASGKYQVASSKQSFKADIRIIRDSVIWIELSDPIVGIKAGRGIFMKDSAAFINRIENTYMAGSLEYFEEKLKTHIEFDMIQNILLGEPMRDLDEKEKMQLDLLEKLYALYYFPKTDELFQFTQPNFYFEIEPTNFNIMKQEAVDGGRKISAVYSDYSSAGAGTYPGKLNMTLAFENNITLQLQYLDVKEVEELRMPFKISSKYQRLD